MNRIKVYVIDYGRKFLVMQWTDPTTGKRCTRSTKTTKRREASIKAAELEKTLNSTRATGDGSIPWESFFDLYEHQELSGKDQATAEWHIGKLNVFGRTMQPANLAAVNAICLSQYVAKLRGLKRAEETVRGHLLAIRMALAWAQSQGYITDLPTVPNIRISGRRKSRGRDITFWEFVRMLRAVGDVLEPHQVESWRRLLIGLWISGLRISEALKLSWDDPHGIRINLRGSYPVLEIDAVDDKKRRDRLLPITPDFHRWLLRTPESERTGRVFRLLGKHSQISSQPDVSDTISRIGEAAKVIVDHRRTKYASAHDLRRTFGTRWAKLVPMDMLQLLMRHDDVETTKAYYVGQSAQVSAASIWQHLTKDTTPGTTPARPRGPKP